MKKHDIYSIIDRIKLAPRVEEQKEKMRSEILDSIHARMDRDAAASRRRRIWAAAASVAVVVAAGLFMVLGIDRPVAPAPMEYVAQQGHHCTVTLPDGSTVELNGGSTLRYDAKAFGKGSREVSLSGEAFFDVAKNPDAPFTVHNGDLNVTVLGTRFNVAGYRDSEQAKVTLESGKVKVSLSSNHTSMVLMPGQQSLYNKKNGTLRKRDVDVAAVMSWLSGGVFFDDEPLADVARRLEAGFGVAIGISSDELASTRYNGAFTSDDDIDRIFSILSRMDSRMRYRTSGDSITIYSDTQNQSLTQ